MKKQDIIFTGMKQIENNNKKEMNTFSNTDYSLNQRDSSIKLKEIDYQKDNKIEEGRVD